jgi:hypothetical protein
MMTNTLTLELPKSLLDKIEQLAKRESISINQFLVAAAAEKISILLSQSDLEEESAKAQREDFEKVLKAVPAVEPAEEDKII